MQFRIFKSIQIFSNGSLFFCKNNFIKFKTILILEKDLKNFQFNKKKKINSKTKLKYSSTYKIKYIK